MIWELPETIESATHAQVMQVQDSWDEEARPSGSVGTAHLRVRFGSVEDGEFQTNPVMRTAEVRVLPDEWEDFRAFQVGELGAPSEVVEGHEWRRADLLRYFDHCTREGYYGGRPDAVDENRDPPTWRRLY